MSNEHQHPGLPVDPSDLRPGARGTGQGTLSDLLSEIVEDAKRIPMDMAGACIRVNSGKALALAEAQRSEIERLTRELAEVKEDRDDLAGEILAGAVSEFGLYDGEDAKAALACLNNEIGVCHRFAWILEGHLNNGSARLDDLDEAVKQCVSQRAAAQADAARYREALKPFARWVTALGALPSLDDRSILLCVPEVDRQENAIRWMHIRDAAAALCAAPAPARYEDHET